MDVSGNVTLPYHTCQCSLTFSTLHYHQGAGLDYTVYVEDVGNLLEADIKAREKRRAPGGGRTKRDSHKDASVFSYSEYHPLNEVRIELPLPVTYFILNQAAMQ